MSKHKHNKQMERDAAALRETAERTGHDPRELLKYRDRMNDNAWYYVTGVVLRALGKKNDAR